MSIHNRPALLLCLCAAVCLTGESQAFTLHRIAASLDVRHVAAANASRTSVINPSMLQPMTPATAALNSPSTEIEITLSAESDVEIQVVDEAGMRVCGARVHMPAGVQKLGFCGRDAQGRALPNGVYYYNVIVGDDVSTTRVTIAR